jgi:hypothetical protein
MIIDDTDTNPNADTEMVTDGEEVTELEAETEEPIEGAEQLTDEELEEIEHDGKKALVPKWIKPLTLFQADYTKKTQEVAEKRKATEAREAQIAEREKAFQEDAKEYSSLVALDHAIKQYEDTITQYRQQGQHEAAQRLWQELMEMRHQAGRISYGLQQKQQLRQQESERSHANRVRERDEALAREISGFSPALMSKIQDYAVADGYTPEEAQSLIDARYVKTLNKARLWDEYQAKTKQAAAKAKQQEVPEAKPTPTVSARRQPERLNADLAKRDPEKWVQLRNQQLAARGRH